MEKKLEFTNRAKSQILKITKTEAKKYEFSFDDKLEKDDVLFDQTIIDKSSLDIIAGSTVDFKEELIGQSFVINNPKASASCGCGLSFSV